MGRRDLPLTGGRIDWMGCALAFLTLGMLVNLVFGGVLLYYSTLPTENEEPQPQPTPQVVQVPVEVPVVVEASLELQKVPIGLLNRQVVQDNLHLESYGYEYDPNHNVRAIAGTPANYGWVYSDPSVPELLICAEVKIVPSELAYAGLGSEIVTTRYYILYRFVNQWQLRTVPLADFWRLNCNIY